MQCSDWVHKRPLDSYSTAARFGRDDPNGITWSIVLTFEPQGDAEIWDGRAGFLVKQAPMIGLRQERASR